MGEREREREKMTFNTSVSDGDIGGDGRYLTKGQRGKLQLLDVGQANPLDGCKGRRVDVDGVAVGRRERDGLPAVSRHAPALQHQMPATADVYRRFPLHLRSYVIHFNIVKVEMVLG